MPPIAIPPGFKSHRPEGRHPLASKFENPPAGYPKADFNTTPSSTVSFFTPDGAEISDRAFSSSGPNPTESITSLSVVNASRPDRDSSLSTSYLCPSFPPKSRRLLRPTPSGMLPHCTPKWKRNFDIGTRLPIFPVEIHSIVVAGDGIWDAERMSDLVQEFCWRFADARPEEIEAILMFLQRLWRHFKNMKDCGYAELFEWRLKEGLVGTFISAWDAKINPEAISCNARPSPRYVFAAVQLSCIIGQMFARGILDARNITDCIETLTRNCFSIEHIEAIAGLVHRSGFVYWNHRHNGAPHLRSFLSIFITLTSNMNGERSVLGRCRSNEEFKKLFEGVIHQCLEWQTILEKTPVQTNIQTATPFPPGLV